MPNKKINQLNARVGAALSDLILIGDPTLGTSFKLTATDFRTLLNVVTYTGATGSVNLGAFSLTANSIIKSGGTSSQFLKANGSVDSSVYITGITSGNVITSLGYTPVTNTRLINTTSPIVGGGDLSADRTISIPVATGSVSGYLSSSDFTTFNNKQGTISLTTTGISGASTLVGATLNIPQYADQFVGTVTSVSFSLGASGTDLNSSVTSSTTTPSITLNVPTASATNRGALSSADFTTFNNKQAAGNYITALSGEVTASGPGSVAATLLNSAVIGKVLTGLNLVGGGTILNTDTILQAFGKTQNQISALVGGVNYDGVWNATTNTPAIVSSTGSKGDYYVVNVAGSTNIDGITDWKVGDWIIFNGTVWDKVDNTDAVSSVNSFVGAVSLTTANIPEVTSLYYLDSRARASLSFVAGSGAYNSTTGAITIPTNNNQIANGSAFITLTSLSAGTGISYSNTTGVISNTITQYTDALARASISLTTTGTSGASIYSSSTGVLNVPNYTLIGLGGVPLTRTLTINGTAFDLSADRSFSVGTVTSVGLSSATSGVTIGATPVTTSGTITLAIATATGSQNGLLSSADFTTFNNKQGTISLTTTGTSGASTYSSYTGVLNIPNYTLAGLGGLPLAGGTMNEGAVINMIGNDPGNGFITFKNVNNSNRQFRIIAGRVNVTNAGFSIFDATASATRFFIDNFGNTELTGELTGTSATFSADILINSVNVGRGGGNISSNTRIGTTSLLNNTTGAFNSAMGLGALSSNTTGTSNSAMGANVLLFNTTGDFNSAMGVNALFSNTTGAFNSAMGVSALLSNTAGDFNSAMGLGALSSNTTGNNNTAIGYNTGIGITTGANNTIIGSNVTGLSATLTNNIILADGSGNQRLKFSSTGAATFSSTVYSGTSTINPSAQLEADSTTKGFLPPRMTTAQINAIVTPAEGLMAYNTTLSHLCVYQAGAWVKLSHSPM